ncbi:MAG: helix-hairpin-helix domain-containing protein [Thermoplasmata archaeon]|jgi:DNA polymerase/3'-5' exonuclease PolX|nr:helix-hairpin-helix domain-containing protein [Thermoplasmata archaeon]
MVSNPKAAEIFRGIADLLDVMGERFKPEAYRRAARSIDSLTEDLAAVAGRGDLRSIPGVGDAIEEKLREYLASGRVDYYDRLQKDVPAGVAEMLRIPGLGPKTARRFWVELGIEGPAELLTALDAGRLVGVKGFGEKKIAQIRSAVEAHRAGGSSARLPIAEAYPIALALVRGLREGAGAERVEVAGSFRRGRETVGDLDLLVTTEEAERAFDVFSALPQVKEVRLRGGTKETVLLQNGLQVDLRVVEPAAFGAALVYFTGSKDHNVQIRSLAKDLGLRVNEYGVLRGEERVAGRTEEDVYQALGLAWVPPELREARGEVEAAARGPLPTLVGADDLRGDLHVHLPSNADPDSVDRLLAAGRERGLAYLGVVVVTVDRDGVRSALPDSLRTHLRNASGPQLRTFEVGEFGPAEDPSSPTGDRRPPEWWVARPTKRSGPLQPPSDARGRVFLVAHRGLRDLGDVRGVAAWNDFARKLGAAVEVGPGEDRLDSTWARQARESGLRISLPTGVGESPDSPTGPIALRFARRAGALPSEVLNAEPQPPISGAAKP